jgi:hypothetical protein
MPVLVSCDCGKQLQVPDQYVGKPVKCPGCQKIHIAQAPARTEPALAQPARAELAPQQPAMLRFNCSCGQLMQVKAEYAGRATKCPGCGKTLTIPGAAARDEASVQPRPSAPVARSIPDDEEDEPPPRRRSREVVEEDEDEPRPRRRSREAAEEDEDEPRPRRRSRESDRPEKGGRRIPLWALAAAGVVLLAVVGLGAWFLFSGPSGDLALIPADAQGFATLRVADLWKTVPVQDVVQAAGNDATDALAALEQATGFKPEDIERATVVVKDATANPPSLWVIVSTTRPWDKKKVLDAAGMPAAEKKQGDVVYHVAENGTGAFYLASPKTAVFASTEDALKACLAQQDRPVTKGPLAQAIKQAGGKDHLAGGFAIPQQVRDQFKGQIEALPRVADALDIQSLWVVGNFSGKDLQVELTGEYPSSDKAKAGKEAADSLKFMAGLFLGQLGDPALAGAANNFLKSLTISQSGSNVVVKASGPVDVKQLGGPDMVKALLDGAAGGLTPGLREAMNNLSQITMALHNYHDSMGGFPTSVWVNWQNNQQYSWRVALLPYLEEVELYNKIIENGAWDSPANRELAARMPKVFQVPGKPAGPGKTFYQAFAGPDTMFGPLSVPPLPPGIPPPRGHRILEIKDGTSNTLAIVEGAEAVDWMKPGSDILFEPGPQGFPVAKLANHWRGNIFIGAFFDGSVHTIPRKIDPKVLQALITHSGGEVIPIGFDK